MPVYTETEAIGSRKLFAILPPPRSGGRGTARRAQRRAGGGGGEPRPWLRGEPAITVIDETNFPPYRFEAAQTASEAEKY